MTYSNFHILRFDWHAVRYIVYCSCGCSVQSMDQEHPPDRNLLFSTENVQNKIIARTLPVFEVGDSKRPITVYNDIGVHDGQVSDRWGLESETYMSKKNAEMRILDVACGGPQNRQVNRRKQWTRPHITGDIRTETETRPGRKRLNVIEHKSKLRHRHRKLVSR